MFTRTSYTMETDTKTGHAVVKLLGQNLSWTVVTKTTVKRFPKVPIPGRDTVHHSTNLVQTFHNEAAALSEYNRQKASLEHHSWIRKVKVNA